MLVSVVLGEQWPGIDAAPRFEFGQTPLTPGMSDDELQELKACLQPMDVAAGPLFCQADAESGSQSSRYDLDSW